MNNQPTLRGDENNRKGGSKKILLLLVLVAVIAIVALLFAFPLSGGESFVAPKMTDDIVITIHGDRNTQVLKGEDYIEAGAYAIDKNEGPIAKSVEISGNVDTKTTGTYTITYTAYNSKNECATAQRTVNVVDSMDKDTDGISVMMYHYVYADAAPPAELNSNFLPASSFEAQLKWLKENNYYYPSYKELRAYIEGKHSLPKKSVILTFDDGEEGFLGVGGELLKKYEIPATSFIIGNLPQTASNLKTFANPYIDYQSHTYGCHVNGTSGKGHGGKIFDLNADQQVADLKQCNDILGFDAEALAYPFGDCDESCYTACKNAGILCAFTVDYNQVHIGDNPYALSRMRIFGTGSLSGFIYQVESGKD